MTVDSIIALGSNLGESRDTLSKAIEALVENDRISVEDFSPVAVTAPVGGPEGQPDYLNQIVRVSTDLSPFALLRFCQGIEEDFHRVRTVRWGPRTLDVDIVTFGDLYMDEPELSLPHPHAAERAFVLAPWARMDPDAVLDGVPVAELAERAADRDGIRGYLDATDDPEPSR
ncbi:2-amino-4-hydroxy-6-hydroxymethyldihydropteridine diphosphokinase [Rothia sp. HC945]|uniref:2-amino-4-hydroxy-6- hydroxymethyldihydropteridine diphosphokinase n=1 Tax=Rothia sp. HC945 TaxID=3171170 RepID=UPI0026532A5A|nr:2-amino-4-hydroxy-6-hydroxymethyldihydropteridine diphosphokinase [Kocuria sp.]MDN5618126.1 2-amino-4-hydroxy-6-hydroxymethyldihydropteridine diphosphokinase [Kocuria sp.]